MTALETLAVAFWRSARALNRPDDHDREALIFARDNLRFMARRDDRIGAMARPLVAGCLPIVGEAEC